MLSPSPTQQTPTQPAPEQKPVRKVTPLKRRAGETPAAKLIKGLFRPPIKAIYYLLRWIQAHKLVTFIILLLCLTSIVTTNYLTTGSLPFGIGSDPFNFHVGGGDGGGDKVKNWLYAIRDGNATGLQLLDKDMSNPPDTNQLISQYSQTKAGVTWKSINVMGAYTESDMTVDSFVQVEISTTGPGGETKGLLVWHFTSISAQGQEYLLKAELVDARAPLA